MPQVQPLAGRYRFLQQLTSAPRSVWLAQDDTTGLLVVAAYLPPRLASRLAPCVGIQHPHLACLLSVLQPVWRTELPEETKEVPDGAVAVAEWVAGRSLYDVLLRDPLTVLDAVQVIATIASAIVALHARHASHGSLSARSILLERYNAGPVPVLTQIAMPADGSYASPERLGGEGPSALDDVWALHVLLYVSLAGRRPFRAKTREDLVRIVSEARPVPLQAFGVHDQTLQTIVDDGLRFDVRERTTEAKELESRLTKWLAEHRLERTSEPGELPHEAQEFELTLDVPAPVSEPGVPEIDELAPIEGAEPIAAPGPVIDVPIRGFDPSQPSLAPDGSELGGKDEPPIRIEIPPAPGLPTIGGTSEGEPAPAATSADATPIPTGDSEPPPPAEAGGDGTGHCAEPEPEAPRPSQAARPAAKPRSLATTVAALALVAVAGAAVYGALKRTDAQTAPSTVRLDPSAPEVPATHTALSLAASAAPAHPEPFAVPAREERAKTPEEISQCIAGMFTPDTFAIAQDLTALCKQPDPRKGSLILRTKIVRGSAGYVSGGMNEWPRLLWHELAAYGMILRKCCPGAPPVKLPPSKGECPSLEAAVNDLSTEFAGGNKDLGPQLDRFDAAALCALRVGDRAYRYPTGPKTGGQVFFYEILKRNL